MRKHIRAVAWGLAALAAGAGVAACGGGGGKTLSVEEFVTRGNAICKKGDADLVDAGKELLRKAGKQNPTPEAMAKFFTDEALPIARKKLDELDDLKEPEIDRAKLKDLIVAGRQAIDKVEEGLRKDGPAFLTAQGKPDPFADFDKKANEIGLTGCAGSKTTG